MTDGLILPFEAPAAADKNLTGGKGANLARMTGAGFPVPPGVVVTTRAYTDFIAANNLWSRIAALLGEIDYADSDQLDAKAAAIRALIHDAPVPRGLHDTLTTAYRGLGVDSYVAVRSSGTAEDLADTSFAGQHDTYLDIRGEEEVVAAVRACWASMWSARVIAYRQQHRISHEGIAIAVVVQRMVASEVSGVLFTANPITGAVDEIVINAAWGLGEGVVSGILTPDQYVLQRDTLALLSEQIGAKEVKVVRNPETGQGTVEQVVSATDRAKASLDAAQARELGLLARKVQEYYEGMPQDIEWGYSDGRFYLLQSRDITGVEFSWDEDLDDPEWAPPASPDITWTRAWGDAVWPGAVTPLFYSFRGEMVTRLHKASEALWGLPDVAGMTVFKYHKGRVYYNSAIDYENVTRLLPSALRREEMFQMIPREWRDKAKNESWSLLDALKRVARIKLIDPTRGLYSTFDYTNGVIATQTDAADGLPVEEIRSLTDRQLKQYVNDRVTAQSKWVEDLWTAFFAYMPFASGLLGWMVDNWYDGDNPMMALDLITGLDRPTVTLRENFELWSLAEIIRGNAEVRALFDGSPDGSFFAKVRDIPAGGEFVTAYDAFMHEYGHRGHPDRDILGARRSEDPMVDYNNLRAILTVEAPSPAANIEKLVERRKAATEEMVASIRRKPVLAELKVQAFHVVHDWLLRFWELRDNERHFTDRITFSKKKAAQELGRRLHERGIIECDDDFYYLSKQELFELLDRGGGTALSRAKIAGRRRNLERVDKEFQAPPYILRGVYTDLDVETSAAAGEEGVFKGQGTSRGTITGTARIIASQKEIGKVREGDILITSATDPGWTPVFLVISGLVLETGGMLAHGSCISREYGIPAVQIPDAMRLIPDGATISVNGDTGEVRILSVPGDEQAPATQEIAA